MYKRVFFLSLVLVLVMGLIFGFGVWCCFAQEESITITTYYPSPYGVYNELQSNKLAVGDTDGDLQLTSADQPPANGQLYTARSVIYKPQSSLPVLDTRKGEAAYSNADNSLYLYDGSAWVKQGGGGSCYVSYAVACLAGFTNKGSLGGWGCCARSFASYGYSFFRPAGVVCPAPWTSGNAQGVASVCCQ